MPAAETSSADSGTSHDKGEHDIKQQATDAATFQPSASANGESKEGEVDKEHEVDDTTHKKADQKEASSENGDSPGKPSKDETTNHPNGKEKAEHDSYDAVSEGEEADPLAEYLRVTRNRVDTKNLKNRIKLAPKRRNQYHQYVNLIEERITALEHTYNALDRRLRKDKSNEEDSETEGESKRLIFKLSPQLWSEFKKYRPPDSRFHAIDMLVEEPEYSNEQQPGGKRGAILSKLLGLERDDESSSDPLELSPEGKRDEASRLAESLKGHRLPERIRINSIALQYLLRKHLHPGSQGTKSFLGVRYTMLRPFKALSHSEEEIKGLMEDVLKILENLRKTSNTKGNKEKESKKEKDKEKEEEKESESISPDTVVAHNEYIQNPDKPMPITRQTWVSIFKELDLFHVDLYMESVARDWPTDVDVKKTFSCLLEFMDQYVKPVRSRIRRRGTKTIRFAELWHLFRPGDEIVTRHAEGTSQAVAMRVLQTNGGRRHIHPSTAPSFDSTSLPAKDQRVQPVNGVNPFSIHAWYLDFDGKSLTPVRRRIIILPYVGERTITDLDVFPISYAADNEKLKIDLIARGKRFVSIVRSVSVAYCDYKGEDLDTEEELDDKVIVDMREYSRSNGLPGYAEPDALDMSETSNCGQGLDCTAGPECSFITVKIVHDQYTEKVAVKGYLQSQSIFQQFNSASQREHIKLTEEDYAFCNYRLYAYKLRTRDWVQIHVNNLKDISTVDSDKGFERLVLPASHRFIIKSQVKEHFRKKAMATPGAQDNLDLVRGKGQGLIILLHGAPGVGKTCTAETIAELVHKPLYPITCGDLGSTATEVEQNLKQHFTLASKWDCVMLLDEADVFLAKRRIDDLHRNSIVSVFLRIMEYYKGLLFLTTNRVGTFDEAFKSRVHISLFYADFDKKTTVKVWKTFLQQTEEAISKKGLPNFEIRAKEITKFAKEHWEENPEARWNGRQIRNAFHTALAMAEFDAREKYPSEEAENVKVVLGREQFAKIASTVKDFDRYMIETMGVTFEQEADKNRLRKWRKSEDRDKEGKRREVKKGKKVRYEESDDSSDSSSSEEDDSDAEKETKSKKGKKKGAKRGKAKVEEKSSSESSSEDSD